jgi:hypothetical protein
MPRRCTTRMDESRWAFEQYVRIEEVLPPIPTFADGGHLSGESVPKENSTIILVHRSPTRNPTRPRSISLRFAKAQITDTASYTSGSKRHGLMGPLPALDLVPSSNPVD